MTQSDLFDQKPVFQLKGGMLAATVLELTATSITRLRQQLEARVAQAPQLFRGSPLILALEKLPEDEALDLDAIVRLCREQGLLPMGVRAQRPADLAAAEALGLPVLPPARGREKAAEPEPGPEPQAAPVEAVASAPVPAAGRPGRIVTQPVRGGQQIYAEGSDLIVLAPVSAGAEIIADGHIHCYGVLRGRALAGVKGDGAARIFCRQLEAELLAIAGRYRIAEELRKDPLWGKGAQAALEGETLSLGALVDHLDLPKKSG